MHTDNSPRMQQIRHPAVRRLFCILCLLILTLLSFFIFVLYVLYISSNVMHMSSAIRDQAWKDHFRLARGIYSPMCTAAKARFVVLDCHEGEREANSTDVEELVRLQTVDALMANRSIVFTSIGEQAVSSSLVFVMHNEHKLMFVLSLILACLTMGVTIRTAYRYIMRVLEQRISSTAYEPRYKVTRTTQDTTAEWDRSAGVPPAASAPANLQDINMQQHSYSEGEIGYSHNGYQVNYAPAGGIRQRTAVAAGGAEGQRISY